MMDGQEDDRRISRRSFISFGAVGALSLCGLTTLQGCTTQSGTGETGSSKDAASEIEWDREVDVIVVGSGTAGTAAAFNAHKAGLEVVIIEKGKAAGGISSMCEQYCAPSSKLAIKQRAEGIEDSPEKMLEDLISISGGTCDPALAKTWIDKSEEVIDWMVDNGCEFKDALRYSEGRSGQGKYITKKAGEISTKILPQLQNDGVEVLLESPLSSLVVSSAADGTSRVEGVVYSSDGKTMKARKGVVVCTGPWCNDETLLALHRRQIPETVQKTGETLASLGGFGPYTGEAVISAQKIGATTRHMEYIMFEPWYSIPDLMSNGVMPAGMTRSVTQVMLDLGGRRFTDEGKDRGSVAEDVFGIDRNTFITVIDNKDVNEPTGSTKQPIDKLSGLAGKGVLAMGDTIEELAADIEGKFGIPKDAVVASLNTYNQYCADGEDKDFHKDKHYLAPLDQAPFVAGPLQSALGLYTHGGLAITTKAEVLDDGGKVIPGLYAAGLCTGGALGAKTVSGNWQVSSAAFGLIAGENVASA